MPWRADMRLKIDFSQRNELYRIEMPDMGPFLKADKSEGRRSWKRHICGNSGGLEERSYISQNILKNKFWY
jgi:hypothetical protein